MLADENVMGRNRDCLARVSVAGKPRVVDRERGKVEIGGPAGGRPDVGARACVGDGRPEILGGRGGGQSGNATVDLVGCVDCRNDLRNAANADDGGGLDGGIRKCPLRRRREVSGGKPVEKIRIEAASRSVHGFDCR